MSQTSHPHPPLDVGTYDSWPLEVRGASVGYRRDEGPVLNDVWLTCSAGTLTHLAGRNGSGKSTLLELASGYLRPWSGSVRVAGYPAESPQARARRRVCRTAPALYPSMTVREHLELACSCVGGPLSATLSRTDAYGLGPWLDHETRELSTGNARKTWLLMCSVGDADLRVLDEPFNGLDSDAATVLLAELAGWRSSGAVVLIAHHLPDTLIPDSVVTLPSEGA